MSRNFLVAALLASCFLHAEKVKVDADNLFIKSDRIFLRTDRGLEPITSITVEAAGLYAYKADIDFGLFWRCECGAWNGSSDEHCHWCDKRR